MYHELEYVLNPECDQILGLFHGLVFTDAGLQF